jgi:uroporphyrin-3 C-methyltransferase
VLRDLDRVRAAQVADVPSLSVRLDEVVRLVDDLPLLAAPERRTAGAAKPDLAAKPGGAAASQAVADWTDRLATDWHQLSTGLWNEVRSLVRVTHIDHPEAALIAPEQAYFLRENLKLRLLNARLSLLSRQFDLAQADLLQAQAMVDRYFDRNARRTAVVSEQLRLVGQQARQVSLPRPDETLAALATAAAGR